MPTFDENGALLVNLGGTFLQNDGSGASPRVAFWSTALTLGGDAGLTVDAANDGYIVADAGFIGNNVATARLGFDSSGGTDYAYFLGCDVGVGTSTPTLLEGGRVVHAESATGSEVITSRLDSSLSDGDFIGSYLFKNNDTSGTPPHYAGIRGVAAGTFGRMALRFYSGRDNLETDVPGMILVDSGGTGAGDTQYLGLGTTTPNRKAHAVDDSASTGIIIPIARLESQVSGGAGAAGHGASLELYGESSTTENQSMGQYVARWSVATHASRRARLEMYAAYIGTDVLVGVLEAPANASADGNSRGVGAVDLQGHRTAATHVAGAINSVLIGGQQSEISAGCDNSVVLAGSQHNMLVGQYCAIISGLDNSINGPDYASILGGRGHLASTGDYSAIIGGREAQTTNYGQVVNAAGQFATWGDAQGTIQQVVRLDQATHVLNTWYALYPDGGTLPERLTIAASSAWTVHVLIIGITANTAQQWSYELNGIIERDNAGNTTLAAFNTTTIFESDANYDAQLAADNVNEALEVQVRRTGGVDYSVQWVATVRTVEVTHT